MGSSRIEYTFWFLTINLFLFFTTYNPVLTEDPERLTLIATDQHIWLGSLISGVGYLLVPLVAYFLRPVYLLAVLPILLIPLAPPVIIVHWSHTASSLFITAVILGYLYCAWSARLRWKYFLLIPIVALVLTAAGIAFNLKMIAFFISGVFLIQFLRLALYQNAKLTQNLLSFDSVKIALRSIKYFIFFVAAAWLVHWPTQEIQQEVGSMLRQYLKIHEHEEFEAALRRRISEEVKKTKGELGSTIGNVAEQAERPLKQAPNYALQTFDKNFPPPENISAFDKRSCGFLAIRCCIVERIRAEIRAKYTAERSVRRAELNEGSAYLSDQGVNEIRAVRSEVETASQEFFSRFETAALNTVGLFSQALGGLSLLINLIFIAVALKCLFVIIGRVSFDKENGYEVGRSIGISFADGHVDRAIPYTAMTKQTQPKSHKDAICISTEDRKFYAVREEKLHSQEYFPDRFALVQPFRCTMSRILNGKYILNEIEGTKNKKVLKFTNSSGRRFIEVDLSTDEHLFFSWKNLVAIESTASFETEVSLRLSTLGLGRVFFHYIRGPGTIIFISDGETTEELSGDPNRLIAWSRDTRFSSNSEFGPRLFFDKFSLANEQSKCMIADATPMRPGWLVPARPISRFISTFILPV